MCLITYLFSIDFIVKQINSFAPPGVIYLSFRTVTVMLKTYWRNNNALPCSDNKLCTRNDKCHYGVCKGTPFTCLSCESCDGYGCIINPGYCVINGTCYRHGNLRPEKPCQVCLIFITVGIYELLQVSCSTINYKNKLNWY